MRQRLELRRDFQRGKFRSHSELETITLQRVSRLGPRRELNLGARLPAHLSVGGSTVDTQSARAEAFKSLHDRSGIFAIPNPWDARSASILTTLGFEALATTSAGFAFSIGRPDAEGAIGREETLANARTIVDATSLPVSADLENGFGDDPDTCADTIRQAAALGLVGGSIEDATGHAGDPIYAYDLSVRRVQAAVQAARSSPFPFVLTARAENLIHGRPDLQDTIRPLRRNQRAVQALRRRPRLAGGPAKPHAGQ